ncbi:metal ABC transporter ATP-binding protein [candidate division WOR-3 bacterium]|nr:metal ABC transporter ATP-binding protein [candidate division WOR-3 bacterium]
MLKLHKDRPKARTPHEQEAEQNPSPFSLRQAQGRLSPQRGEERQTRFLLFLDGRGMRACPLDRLGASSEPGEEILRSAQNDKGRRAQNDRGSDAGDFYVGSSDAGRRLTDGQGRHILSLMAESAVAFEHVTVAFQRGAGIEDVSFELGPGEFLGIIGPNGSGKTTLLRTVLGLLRPVAGGVTVLGARGRGVAEMRRRIGYVPQRKPIEPGFPVSGLDAVIMGTYATLGPLRRAGRSEKKRAQRALAAVGLSAAHDHVAGHLSGGQQQRLLLARALVQEPEILLLDEPTAGVDVASRRQIVELVRGLHRERGLTTLYVTHDVNEIMPCVDKVMYLNRTVRAFGPCAEVTNPKMLEELYGSAVVVVEREGRPYVIVGDSHG